MRIDNKIRDEKLQYDITREAAKISVFSSEKINKHEYLIAEQLWLSSESRMVEEDRRAYCSLGKAIE